MIYESKKMFLFGILLISLFLEINAAPFPNNTDITDERIVNGVTQLITERKFQVAVLPGGYICGGTLVRLNVVVTAAHCTTGFGPAGIKVRAGSNHRDRGGVLVNVKTNIVHEKYVDASLGFDIAILILKTKLTKSNIITAIGLADKVPGAGTIVRVSGYGTLSSEGNLSPNLMSVDVKIISRTTCNNNYGGGITNTMICAGYLKGGKDSCQGDSGGPLTLNGALLGIVSWGNGCALKRYPGIYTNVPFFAPWINEKIKNFT